MSNIIVFVLSYSKHDEIMLKYILQNIFLPSDYINPKGTTFYNCPTRHLVAKVQWTMYMGRNASFLLYGWLPMLVASSLGPNLHLFYWNLFCISVILIPDHNFFDLGNKTAPTFSGHRGKTFIVAKRKKFFEKLDDVTDCCLYSVISENLH